MSRLDRHVTMVQNKLALGRFVSAMAWASLVYAAGLWIGIVVDRLFHVRPPHLGWVLIGAGATAVLAALIYSLLRRPTAHQAAMAIDDKLSLKEKFSTALYARELNDPFAQAAVKDAEQAAQNVSLHKRFPLAFPRQSMGTAGVVLLVALTMWLLPPVDLFGREAAHQKKLAQEREVADAKKAVERALDVVVQTQARGAADEDAIKEARKELAPLINGPIRDPEKARRSAARALEDINEAIKQQMAGNQRYADAQNDAKAFRSLMPGADEKGPVADAQRKIAKGDFADAVDDLQNAVKKFDQMSDQQKKAATTQMAKMAQQLKQMANNPQVQQQIQKQLQQQAGMTQKQAQQAAQLMKQAAQGNPQAQQQLQQMAQQAMQQMTPQQRQQAQQIMKQMQAQANAQSQAQQMQQAAQQMAQAMKQAQQQGAQQMGQQPGGAQQQAQGQMGQAMQQMQQQLQQMQAMKSDAQQVAAAQQAAADAAADAAAGLNGGGQPGQQGAKGNWNGNNGQFGHGNNRKFNGPNQGMQGGGIGAGDRNFKEVAPYHVKEEISHSQDIDGGKILASTLIKAKNIKGESKVTAEDVAPPPKQDQTDEVEQDRISRQAQETVKKYFSAWKQDAAAQ